MKSIPRFLRGPYRTAMRVALGEINVDDAVRQERGWKLFLLLPRMLLHRAPRGGTIPKAKLLGRFDLFNAGAWLDLLEASAQGEPTGCSSSPPQESKIRTTNWRRGSAELKRWCTVGEVSSARQALEGSSLAPGVEATLNASRDPTKRPRHPRTPLPRELSSPEPQALFNLDEFRFCRKLRSARSGAAGGPFRNDGGTSATPS